MLSRNFFLSLRLKDSGTIFLFVVFVLKNEIPIARKKEMSMTRWIPTRWALVCWPFFFDEAMDGLSSVTHHFGTPPALTGGIWNLSKIKCSKTARHSIGFASCVAVVARRTDLARTLMASFSLLLLSLLLARVGNWLLLTIVQGFDHDCDYRHCDQSNFGSQRVYFTTTSKAYLY